ncbi:unnamed protein product, partial [Ectocarpus sp. 8 AP-2014]
MPSHPPFGDRLLLLLPANSPGRPLATSGFPSCSRASALHTPSPPFSRRSSFLRDSLPTPVTVPSNLRLSHGLPGSVRPRVIRGTWGGGSPGINISPLVVGEGRRLLLLLRGGLPWSACGGGDAIGGVTGLVLVRGKCQS